MSGKEQRRKQRRALNRWSGRYRLEAAAGWRECTLVDISATGAGFDAFMLRSDAVLSTVAELEITEPSGGPDASIRLRGTIRHLTRSPEGHIRVGIEFLELTELESQLLGMLFHANESRRSVHSS